MTIPGGYLDNLTHRIGLQISGLPIAYFSASDPLKVAPPHKNAVLDNVPSGAAAPTKLVVTKAGCQNCHAPDQAIAHGSRYDPKYCVVCHNATLPPDGNLVRLVHKVHSSDNNVVIGTRVFDFSEVAYPQDIRNCTTCHNDTQGSNWKNVPSIEACGSCHTNVNFATGANHVGGAQDNNSFCGICHNPTLIASNHADPNVTPFNVTAGADNIVYFIDNVTVNGSNQPVVTFHITRNGSPRPGDNPVVYRSERLGGGRLHGLPGLPAGVRLAPGRHHDADRLQQPGPQRGPARQRQSHGPDLDRNVRGVHDHDHDGTFPAGATMRAVALQSYWSQTVGGVSTGRHTPAVVKAVTGDAVRRAVIKSGYNASTGAPEGCLECHMKFEGHGGSRVNNVQVCVICHNPSLTSSGRTIDPTIVINPAIVALFGSDPLLYPEVPNNFKDMIHGIHSSFFRANNVNGEGIEFVDIRNRVDGVLVLGNEVTYPGNLKYCTKCHVGTTYNPAFIPANALLSTTKVTTGNPSETRADILAARASVAERDRPGEQPDRGGVLRLPWQHHVRFPHGAERRGHQFDPHGSAAGDPVGPDAHAVGRIQATNR